MKKKKFILPVFLFILSLIFCGGITQYSTVSVKAATTTKKQTGFVMKNGSWYYYDKNGKKATGWYQSVAGNKYYFGKTGAAKAGILSYYGYGFLCDNWFKEPSRHYCTLPKVP